MLCPLLKGMEKEGLYLQTGRLIGAIEQLDKRLEVLCHEVRILHHQLAELQADISNLKGKASVWGGFMGWMGGILSSVIFHMIARK